MATKVAFWASSWWFLDVFCFPSFPIGTFVEACFWRFLGHGLWCLHRVVSGARGTIGGY